MSFNGCGAVPSDDDDDDDMEPVCTEFHEKYTTQAPTPVDLLVWLSMADFR